MPPVGFETAIRESERPRTLSLDRSATDALPLLPPLLVTISRRVASRKPRDFSMFIFDCHSQVLFVIDVCWPQILFLKSIAYLEKNRRNSYSNLTLAVAFFLI